jgi:hypothetical protein
MANIPESEIQARSKLGGEIIKGITEAVKLFEEETNREVVQILVDIPSRTVHINYGEYKDKKLMN